MGLLSLNVDITKIPRDRYNIDKNCSEISHMYLEFSWNQMNYQQIYFGERSVGIISITKFGIIRRTFCIHINGIQILNFPSTGSGIKIKTV